MDIEPTAVLAGSTAITATVTAPAGTPTASLYAEGIRNLLANSVPGTGDDEPPQYIRAGGGYADPWTRDAAINSWNAASLLEPEVAKNTLLMVCEVRDDGTRVIAQDNQWWDHIIWVIAAWEHFLVTGDEPFLAESYRIGCASLEILRRERFTPEFGLFAGPAVMQDGIAGYPAPPYEEGNDASFVLDHTLAPHIMCLSTNAVYVQALRSLAEMARVLGEASEPHVAAAGELARALDAALWLEDEGRYGYFVHGAGELAGTVDRHQEALGLAFVLMFGLADARKTSLVLADAHREPRGIPNVWPHFTDRYSDEVPGRHNVLLWPMVIGMFADGAARAGSAERFVESFDDLESLFTGSDGAMLETYHAITGEPDGGWQSGKQWISWPDQTWSATAYLRLVQSGVFGMRFTTEGLSFAPIVPARLDGIAIRGVRYRGTTLDITVRGSGDRLSAVRVDGVPADARLPIPADAIGHHVVELELR